MGVTLPNAQFFAVQVADTDVISCVDFGEIRIYSVSEQLKTYHVFTPTDIQQCLVSAWSNDGSQLAVAFNRTQIHIVDTSGVSKFEIELPPLMIRATISHMLWIDNTLAIVRSLENRNQELHLVDTTQTGLTIKSYTLESVYPDERSTLIALSKSANNGLWINTRSQRTELYDINVNQSASLRPRDNQRNILYTIDKAVTWDKLQISNSIVDTWWVFSPDMTAGAIELGNKTIIVFDLVKMKYSIIEDKLLVKFDHERAGFIVRDGAGFELVKIE